MSPITSYLIKKLALWIVIISFSASVVFIATQGVRIMTLFAGSDIGTIQLLKIILSMVVSITNWSLLPAITMGIFAIGGTMVQNGEFTALESMGISRHGVARGPIIIILILFNINLLVSLFGAPAVFGKSAEAVKGAMLDKGVFSLKSKKVQHLFNGMEFYADKKVGKDQFYGVFIKNSKRNDGSIDTMLTGKSAKIKVDKINYSLTLYIKNGTLFVIDKKNREGFKNFSSTFKNMEFKISVKNLVKESDTLIPAQFIIPTARLFNLKINQNRAEYKFELWRRIFQPLNFLFFSIGSLFIAFYPRWFNRKNIYFGGFLMILIPQVFQRGGEVFVNKGIMNPFAGAVFPIATALFLTIMYILVLITVKKLKNRLSPL
ncbi:MAG: LptF/LptG family permease [Deltaproteobacteria bacterium]|nr:LptF/LptG family permease [Deltaproteobacteria bacterium]